MFVRKERRATFLEFNPNTRATAGFQEAVAFLDAHVELQGQELLVTSLAKYYLIQNNITPHILTHMRTHTHIHTHTGSSSSHWLRGRK